VVVSEKEVVGGWVDVVDGGDGWCIRQFYTGWVDRYGGTWMSRGLQASVVSLGQVSSFRS
jgi:hypothetical protein